MKQPVSSVEILNRWQYKVGNISFDTVITMLINKEPIPFKIPKYHDWMSDYEEIQSILRSYGASERIVKGGFADEDDEDIEIHMNDGDEWLLEHISNPKEFPFYGFRLVRNKP